MLDWQKIVRERFAQHRAAASVEPEVADELAGHLEDVCDSGIGRGLSQRDAQESAVSEVKNWRRLAFEINQAREGGDMLKQRILTLWLPGLAATVATLAIPMGVGFLANRVYAIPKAAIFVYGGWLVTAAGIGALAAYWSRRSGGSVAFRTAAALLPAGTMLLMVFTVLIASLVSPGAMSRSQILMRLPRLILDAVALPALALLVGAAPFLKKKPANDDLNVRIA